MKIDLRLKFDDFDDLRSWFDHACTLCAMCNDRRNQCKTCRANKVYKQGLKDFGKEDPDDDDDT